MKKTVYLSILIIISLPNVLVLAQDPVPHNGLKIIGLYSGSIILNAMGDGLNNTHHKTAGHLCNTASLGIDVSMPFLVQFNRKKWHGYLLSYAFLRAGLFDPAYNVVTGQPIEFVGRTASSDKLMRNLNINNVLLLKASFVTIGVYIPLHMQKRSKPIPEKPKPEQLPGDKIISDLEI